MKDLLRKYRQTCWYLYIIWCFVSPNLVSHILNIGAESSPAGIIDFCLVTLVMVFVNLAIWQTYTTYIEPGND